MSIAATVESLAVCFFFVFLCRVDDYCGVMPPFVTLGVSHVVCPGISWRESFSYSTVAHVIHPLAISLSLMRCTRLLFHRHSRDARPTSTRHIACNRVTRQLLCDEVAVR